MSPSSLKGDLPMSTAEPHVSILTPVYNGAKYLRQCVESVLAQTYSNWDYIIVNNCSTDATLQIARSYAARFPNIHIHSNKRFVSVAENHNIAFGLILPESKYCKVVSADDWLVPECLSKMVAFAEAHPSVGIVGAYQRSGDRLKWQGLPRGVGVISGRDVCRLGLLDNTHVLANPTALLYRADLVRAYCPFFPHNGYHCDTSACYRVLEHCDFGFLQEPLSVERVHPEQLTATANRLGMGSLAFLEILHDYGPIYLTPDELASRTRECYAAYYRWLGGCLLKLKGRDFWNFHSRGLTKLGTPLKWSLVLGAAVQEMLAELKNPRVATRKLMTALASKARGE
jgi:glycosyltransferase involved in cell wall biosynthesis